MYYGLSNFYQNHRRYVKSRDDNQLRGNLNAEPSSDCQPFAYLDGNLSKPILPCGAIANSLFSDELRLYNHLGEEVPILRTDIAWPSDRNIKFHNPSNLTDLKRYEKPKNWKKFIWQLDLEHTENNGLQNEDLIVWMRTAALPTFRKLYRRVDHSSAPYTEGLPAGNYTLKIVYCKCICSFGGTRLQKKY